MRTLFKIFDLLLIILTVVFVFMLFRNVAYYYESEGWVDRLEEVE